MTMTVLFGTDVTVSSGTFSQQQTVGSFDVSSFASFRLSRCAGTIDCVDTMSTSTMLASLSIVETLLLCFFPLVTDSFY